MENTENQHQKAPSRINSIDAVRATALLLITFTHSVLGFWSGATTQCQSLADMACSLLRVFGTADVGFGMFSFLFGLSFFLQLDHAAQKGIDFRGRFCWRLVLLVGFAILDRLCYRGDILTLFAIMGFVLVLLWKVKTRPLVVICAVCALQLVPFLCHFTDLPALTDIFTRPVSPNPQSAGWADIACWNVSYGFVDYFIVYATSGRYWAVAGFFIMGMLAGRTRIFERGRKAVGKLIVPVLLAWVACLLLEQYVHVGRVFHWWRCTAQVALYVSVLACFYELPLISKRLESLRAIGRCTLTGYISQNAIMCALLYGWGLGLGSSLTISQRALLGLGVYAVQMVVFTIWMRHFKYGPLEGVWRKLTRLGIKR